MYIAAHNGAHVWGGAERATALLLAGLQARGHRVKLYCGDPLVAERAARLDVPTELLPLHGDVAVGGALRFAGALRRERPDVLVIGTFRKLWLAALAGTLAGVPRVVARIGLETDTPRSAKYRFVLRRWVDAVVVNADRIRPAYLALPGWTEDRVFTIYNGVPAPARPDGAGGVRADLGLASGRVLIGSVGRLARQKRFDRLLHALALLPADVHCVLAGDGELRDELERLARELGVESRVHFLGHREDVGPVLAALDVFVLASDREGMSNAMLEAMAAGVPIVSTAVSGAEEALEPLGDGSAPGLIVDFSTDSLAGALRRVIDDAALRARMGRAAQERVRRRFGYDGMLDAWEVALAGSAPAAIGSR